MSDDLAQLRERARQNRAALSDELAGERANVRAAADAVTRTPVAGDRVVLRPGGEVGVVMLESFSDTPGRGTFAIDLGNHRIVWRGRDQFALASTPPAVP